MIDHLPSANPQRLWKRVQSPRLTLPQRLYALGQLLHTLDLNPLHLYRFDFTSFGKRGTTPPVAPASTLLAPTKPVNSATTSATDSPTSAAMNALVADEPSQPIPPCGEVARFFREVNELIHQQLLPRLAQYRLRIGSVDDLTETQVHRLQHYFHKQLYPVLTPLAVDPAHPFPRVVPGRLYFLVTLQSTLPPLRCHLPGHRGEQQHQVGLSGVHGPLFSPAAPTDYSAAARCHSIHADPTQYSSTSAPTTPTSATHTSATPTSATPTSGREVYGLIKVIDRGPRLIAVQPEMPEQRDAETVLFWREEIIRYFMSALFADMQVTGIYQFRIVCPDVAATPLLATSGHAVSAEPVPEDLSLRTRQPKVARIDVEQTIPTHLVQWLTAHLCASTEYVCHCPLPLGMAGLSELVHHLTTVR